MRNISEPLSRRDCLLRSFTYAHGHGLSGALGANRIDNGLRRRAAETIAP
jgi:hypothetical protein